MVLGRTDVLNSLLVATDSWTLCPMSMWEMSPMFRHVSQSLSLYNQFMHGLENIQDKINN